MIPDTGTVWRCYCGMRDSTEESCAVCGAQRTTVEMHGVPDTSIDLCRHCEWLRKKLAEAIAERDSLLGALDAWNHATCRLHEPCLHGHCGQCDDLLLDVLDARDAGTLATCCPPPCDQVSATLDRCPCGGEFKRIGIMSWRCVACGKEWHIP